MDAPTAQLRLCEWASILHGLSAGVCGDIEAAVEAWRLANRLSAPPISFSGAGGSRLCAQQFVGIVEVNGVAIEVFPKLDAKLIDEESAGILSTRSMQSVMNNLLWMLEVSSHSDIAETSTAHLETAPTTFFDIFTFLLGRNLLPELQAGVSHSYVTHSEDLPAVRGRIGLLHQVTRNWNRYDRVFCVWDDFTPDTPMNRLFKCACHFLSERVQHLEATRLLRDCEALLDEVQDVSPTVALRDTVNLRLDRTGQRFTTAFDLASRLLASTGHSLGVGDANTFVFLLNMNDLFEKYVHAVLEAHFKVAVTEQQFLGTLFSTDRGGISQWADYYWHYSHRIWIGDAKYKHLARGQDRALRFQDIPEALEQSETLAGRVLSPADVRQLTVYAELARRRDELETVPELMLLYPYVGASEECKPDSVTAWNKSTFWLTPVDVRRRDHLADAIRVELPEQVNEQVEESVDRRFSSLSMSGSALAPR